MKRHLKATTALLLVLGAMPALAAEPTTDSGKLPDGLKQLFGDKLDQFAPAFSATHDGNVTRLTVDLADIAARAGIPGLSVTAKPITLVFTSQPDGSTLQTMEGPQDLSASYDVPLKPRQIGTVSYSGMAFQGTFDPKLAFYRDLTVTVAKTESESSQPQTGVHASVVAGENTMKLTSEAVSDGIISVKSEQTMNGFSEKLRIDPQTAEPPVGGPMMEIEVTAPSAHGMFAIDRLHTFGVRDLIGFFIENQTKPDIVAHQANLKDLLRATAPLLDTMTAAVGIDKIAVQTPFGRGTIGNVGLKLGLDTGSPSSRFDLGYVFDGIAVDSVFVPDWAKDLIPSRLTIDVSVKDFNVKDGISRVIDAFDLNEPDVVPKVAEAGIQTAFLPSGGVTVALQPSELTAPLYSLTWQGDVHVADSRAKAHFDVHAKGLDKVIQSLQKVTVEGAPQAIIGLYAAKALAKTEGADAYFWAIDIDEAGDLLVNGAPVGPKKKI
ncbi:MAG: hypothetical protein P4L82_22645 [Ancalomicrobiaceae bacterium]|nr:hypothetical protein [Ancalomicrobiaceae bacterium]